MPPRRHDSKPRPSLTDGAARTVHLHAASRSHVAATRPTPRVPYVCASDTGCCVPWSVCPVRPSCAVARCPPVSGPRASGCEGCWRHPKAGSPKRPQRRTRRHGRRRRRTRRRSTTNGAPRQHQMPTPTGSRQPQASGTRSGPNPRHAPHAAAERGHKGNAQPPRPTGDERRQKGAGRRDEACRLGLRITEHERRGRRARIGWSPSLR
jgi:hypothetical protein